MKQLEIGLIVRPQGIKGEVKVTAFTDDAARFLLLKTVYLDGAAVRILQCRVSGNDVFLTLQGVADRNAAETLRGKSLFIDREEAVPLKQDTYFIVDVIGCEVFTTEGVTKGKVKDVLQYGSADIYLLDNGVMFPFLKDVVTDVDTVQKRITVNAKRWEEVAVYED